MGKYSKKNEVRPRDLWPTVDPDAVKSLIPWIKGRKYAEPCCGSGDLIKLIGDNAECVWASDVVNTYDYVKQGKAQELTREDMQTAGAELCITNPPFSWDMLQPIVNRLRLINPTWLLLPADFMHNKRSAYLMKTCSRVVAVGRLYWVLDGGNESMRGIKGKDNYCWYFWPMHGEECDTVFYERDFHEQLH